MTSQAIKLKVTASVPKDCIFQLKDDGWNGVCEELSVTVRGVVLRMRRGKWKPHYRRTSRVYCVSIPGQVKRSSPEIAEGVA